MDGAELVSERCPLGPAQRAELEAAGVRCPEALRAAVAKRREEYLAGRFCALRALGAAGAPAGALASGPSGSTGAPQWPRGFAGSIAHGHGWAAAAAAAVGRYRSLGIDFEPVIGTERGEKLEPKLALPGEAERIAAALPDWSPSERLTLVFCAKEAIYKCLNPLCGEYFGFHDAELVALEGAGGAFEFTLRRALGAEFQAGWRGRGRFARLPGWVFAAVGLAAR